MASVANYGVLYVHCDSFKCFEVYLWDSFITIRFTNNMKAVHEAK